MAILVATLAAALGSEGGAGKIGTIPAAATLFVVCPGNQHMRRVKWVVAADKAFSVQRYVAEENPLAGTLTLADATAVDDGDTFVFNGLTITGEATEVDADKTARKFWLGANNAAAAVNLAALLNDPTHGVPGFTFTVAAVDATDVISFVATVATALQFAQGTSDAAEIAFAETTLASLMVDGAAVDDATVTGNAGTDGAVTEHENDGLVPVIGITNNDGAAAMTAVVKAVRFAV